MSLIAKTIFSNLQSTSAVFRVVSIVAVVILFGYANLAVASVGDNLSGYAWSENIGWISMNCTDDAFCPPEYGVNVAASGALSGYAWSENIGWISFNAADVASCSGGGAPQLDQVTGDVTGWTRALAGGMVGSGGWDGCISLSDAGGVYGVKVSGCDWGGYAWGSDVIGWIKFSGATAPASAPANLYGVTGIGDGNACAATAVIVDLYYKINGGVLTLVSGPITIGASDTVTLSWNSTDADSCTTAGSGFSASAPALSGTDVTITEPAVGSSGTYSVTCLGATSAMTKSIDITTAALSASLTATGCTVPDGSNSCDVGLSWTSSYTTAPRSIKIGGSAIASGNNLGENGFMIDSSVSLGNHAYDFHDNSGLQDTSTAVVRCGAGSVVIAGLCQTMPVQPQISITANPSLVRRGNTADIDITIDSPDNLDCNLYGATAVSPFSFNHTGIPALQTQPAITSKPLNATQEILIECSVTVAPTVTNSASARIEVVGSFQEN